MTATNEQLRVAYTIQNVGGLDLTQDLGDGVPVKYTIRGLQQAGHQVTCLVLDGRTVAGIDVGARLLGFDDTEGVPLLD